MSQSHRASLLEAVVNTCIGFIVTLVAQRLIFPAYGIHSSYGVDMQIVAWFTLLSVARSYVLRRMFTNGVVNGISLWLFKRNRAKAMRQHDSINLSENCSCGSEHGH